LQLAVFLLVRRTVIELGQYRTFLFGLVVGLCWFSLYACIPVLAPYAQEMGASYEMIGLIIGGYGLSQMLMRIPLGILSDRLNQRKIFVIISMLLCMISSMGIWFFPDVQALLIFRSIAGLAASVWVIQSVLYASYFPVAQLSRAMGNISAICYAGQMIGFLFGGITAYYLGAAAIFLVGTISGALGFVLSCFIVETKSDSRQTIRWIDLLATARDKRLNLTALLAALLQFMAFATVFGFTSLVAKKIGANDLELGMMTTLYILPGIVASVLSGPFFAARFGEKKPLTISFVVSAVSCVVTPFISSIPVLYLWQIIGGFARGLAFPLLMSLSIQHIANEKRATAMGYFQAIYGLGMFLGPMTAGWTGAHLGLDWVFVIIGGITLTGAAITKAYLKET